MSDIAKVSAGTGGLPPKVILALGVSILIWGSTWTAIRYQLGVTAPSWSIALRFGIAALVMALYARRLGIPLGIRRADLPLVAAIGLAQFVLNFLFVYNATGFITSGLVAMIFALLIVPNAILGRIFLKHHVGGGFIFGSLLAATGMALLFRHEIGMAAAGGSRAALGIGLSLCAILCASVGNILQATSYAHRLHWSALLVWAMGLAAVMNIMIAFATTGWPQFDPRPSYWLAAAWLAVFGSAITFPIYLYVIRTIGPARAAYSGVLTPIVAMAFSTLLEGYLWTPVAILGAALAVAGMLFALKGKASPEATV